MHELVSLSLSLSVLLCSALCVCLSGMVKKAALSPSLLITAEISITAGRGKHKPCRKKQQREAHWAGGARYSDRKKEKMMKERKRDWALGENSDENSLGFYAHACLFLCWHLNWCIRECVLCIAAFLNIHLCAADVCFNVIQISPFRYKLLRRKTHQPLAVAAVPAVAATSPPPSEDLHHWLHVYSGTKLFYQDKGLSRWDYWNEL